VSKLSNVQFSRISELEIVQILMLWSNGLLEVMLPFTDDERRDIETHLKEFFRLSLAIQIKARHVLVRANRADLLVIRFDEKPERLIANPFFWYVFGYFDLTAMQYRAPLFLIPSAVVHKHADPRRHGDVVRFTFAASMDPHSKDQWRPYACDPRELAERIVKFLRAQSRNRRSALSDLSMGKVLTQPGTLLVGRAA
jgi:hypothetical protein